MRICLPRQGKAFFSRVQRGICFTDKFRLLARRQKGVWGKVPARKAAAPFGRTLLYPRTTDGRHYNKFRVCSANTP